MDRVAHASREAENFERKENVEKRNSRSCPAEYGRSLFVTQSSVCLLHKTDVGHSSRREEKTIPRVLPCDNNIFARNRKFLRYLAHLIRSLLLSIGESRMRQCLHLKDEENPALKSRRSESPVSKKGQALYQRRINLAPRSRANLPFPFRRDLILLTVSGLSIPVCLADAKPARIKPIRKSK